MTSPAILLLINQLTLSSICYRFAYSYIHYYLARVLASAVASNRLSYLTPYIYTQPLDPFKSQECAIDHSSATEVRVK